MVINSLKQIVIVAVWILIHPLLLTNYNSYLQNSLSKHVCVRVCALACMCVICVFMCNIQFTEKWRYKSIHHVWNKNHWKCLPLASDSMYRCNTFHGWRKKGKTRGKESNNTSPTFDFLCIWLATCSLYFLFNCIMFN